VGLYICMTVMDVEVMATNICGICLRTFEHYIMLGPSGTLFGFSNHLDDG